MVVMSEFKQLMDLRGQRFGRLLVQSLYPIREKRAIWECICDCGNIAIVKAGNLRRKGTQSCGCFRREKMAAAKLTHGLTRTPIYLTWVSMIQRCDNSKATGFQYYGGRGIRVCERWYLFENFYADMAPRPKGKTLDRVDPNGHYEPSNCRWATSMEQAATRRPKGSHKRKD